MLFLKTSGKGGWHQMPRNVFCGRLSPTKSHLGETHGYQYICTNRKEASILLYYIRAVKQGNDHFLSKSRKEFISICNAIDATGRDHYRQLIACEPTITRSFSCSSKEEKMIFAPTALTAD